MKIAILTSGGVDRSGTTNVIPCLLWLIERLVRGGDEVHVFALHQEPLLATWRLCGATVHNAGARHSARRLFSQILQEHRRAPFDVLHASWSVMASIIGVFAGRLLGAPSLVYLGNTELVRIPGIATVQTSALGRALLWIALAGADRVATQSAPMVELARSRGIRAGRLPFGVALDLWPPAPPRPRDPGAPLRLLHVGSILPVKDHDMLLDVAAGLQARGVRFEMEVIGEDLAGDGAIPRRTDALGLSDRIRFLGALPHRELRPHFDRADLLLVTSRHEAGPLVVLEAAAAGVPTVGTHVGHIAEWSPLAARAVEPRDSSAMVQAIVDLASDDDARMSLAAQAQQKGLAEDADVTSLRFRQVYAEMVEACRSRRAPRPS